MAFLKFVNLLGMLSAMVLLPFLPGATCKYLATATLPNSVQNILHSNYGLIIGATNNIYRLSEKDLSVVKNVTTGPEMDNPQCLPVSAINNEYTAFDCEQNLAEGQALSLTDNLNQILVVTNDLSSEEDLLLACGNVFHGQCKSYSIVELSKRSAFQKIASYRPGLNTVASLVEIQGGQKVLLVAREVSKVLSVLQEQQSALIQAWKFKSDSGNRPLDDTERLFSANYKISEDGLGFNADGSAVYNIHYVSMFTTEKFVYFTTVQRYDLQSRVPVSRLVRQCLLQTRFSAYVESTLVCRSAAKNYSVIMATKLIKASAPVAALFNVTEGSDVVLGLFRHESDASSVALCSFGLSNINLAIATALEKCTKKGLGQGVPWILTPSNDAKCSQSASDADVDCGQRPLPMLSNEEIIYGHFVSAFTQPLFAGMEAVVHPRGLALFLSFPSYQLKKYAVLNTGLYQYGTSEMLAKTLPDNGGFTRMVYDSTGSFIYAAGGKMVARDTLMDCAERASCKDCLAGPFCGWCTLESRCSLPDDCKTRTAERQTFISDSLNSCPVATVVTPSQISVHMASEVTIGTLNLPLALSLKCSFNGILVKSVTIGDTTTCEKVDFGSIPKLDLSGGSSSIPVSLVIDGSPGAPVVLLSTSLTVYDCGAAEKSCLRCTRGRFPCSWCPQEQRCADASSCAKSGLVYREISYQGPHTPVESSQCPRLTGTRTPHVSFGSSVAIRLSGANLPAPSSGFTYQCEALIDKRSIKSDADYNNETGVTCAPTLFTYDDERDLISNVTASVSLFYGGTLIDASDSTAVTIYKCHVGRSDCSLCLLAPSAFKCGWCDAGSCTSQDQCSSSWITSCVDVTISKFSPMSGAIFGGTRVTIEGSDLGSTVDDVLEVSIAGQSCDVLKELYVSSKRVVCKTVNVTKPVSGEIRIRVRSASGRELQGLSKERFYFEEPVVERFKPAVGPCSGGTELTVIGQHLTVGENVIVKTGGTECLILQDKKFSTNITCVTQPSCLNTRRRRGNDLRGVLVIFDGEHVVASPGDSVFQYLPDPNVTSVVTRKGDAAMKIYFSGGQDIIVTGERFDLVQEPQLMLSLFSQTFLGPCWPGIPVGSQLICMTPNISSAVGTLNRTVVMLGFKMDFVPAVRSVKMVTALSDPHFETFPGDGILEVKTSDLIIRGSGIALLTKGDVTVTVAGLLCKIIALDEKLLACSLPSEEAIGKVTSANPVVQVAVGRGGLVSTLGALKFYKPSKEAVPWLLYIGPPVAGSAVLVIIIIILVVLYRRRSRKEKYAKVSYQRRMDRMESQYARTAKEVFAEYQTEMVDLTQDVDQSHTPYLTFEQFAMRVLYPGLDYHPIMEKESSKSDAWKKCMKSLISLLKERDFLVTFVRTLESQGSFQMTDRCIVASLLMVSMQDDIHYVTEILKDLLVDLINKTGRGKRSKLLLRRTESVAEKLLTNWLAYTLHGFLEDHVGQPLFKLFVAINVLLDKEPVDAVTCDARNSLSEDKLLRQKVDFTNLAVTAEYENKLFPGIALLSCDTITQAKEKILKHIFKNVPYSNRPTVEHMDLGCVSPNGAILVLQDEDATNIIEGEWKRANTLDHYKIPDGSTLRLCVDEADYNGQVHGYSAAELNPTLTSPSLMSSFKRKPGIDGKRRSKSRSLADMNGDGKDSFTDDTQTSIGFQPNTSSTPMLNNRNRDLSFRTWHLVKGNDFQQEPKEDVRQSKMMAEVYLTRLLKTKEALQPYVNDLFSAVFGLYKDGERIIPPSVKLLFDFLDKEAATLDIDDQEVHHTWKNNSLPLRFWINMIKNPNFVFDVKKEPTVDSCLSVIAQLFMDSCSPDEHRLGKDSPSNKLLYAKEIPEYKKKVKKFYADVRQYRPVTEELEKSLDDISQRYGSCFNCLNAASELMTYAVKYKVKVMDSLEEASLGDFADRLQEIMETLPDD